METVKAKSFLLTVAMCIVWHISFAQIHGTVRDQGSNEPLEFATVALLSQSDSSLISGASTDSVGHFSIDGRQAGGILRVSLIGYKTRFINVAGTDDLGIVLLQPDALSLNEVTVLAKTYIHTDEGLTVNIGSGPLSKLGNADDVLKHVPFVIKKKDEFTVLGKGKPVIYINNRLLRDNNELRQINSSDISQIKIITNPGAEYDATVNSVIKITTIRHGDDGWGATVDAGISAERKVAHYGETAIRYRTGGFDAFASVRYEREDFEALQTTKRTHEGQLLDESAKEKAITTTWNVNAGFDYQDKDKLSVGALYKYTSLPAYSFKIWNNTDLYNNGSLRRNFSSNDDRRSDNSSHHVNAYIDYNFTKDTYLKLDADYLTAPATTGRVTISLRMTC